MTKQIKNYIAFGNDYSGSMHNLKAAALRDYNATINAVKNAATREMQDTIVSVYGFGGTISRDVVNSNPHVLKEKSDWRASGGTPMFGALKEIIALFKSMPDYADPSVSFVVQTTTDGDATDSYIANEVAGEIVSLSKNDGRWTFVFRVPKRGVQTLQQLGIPAGNIQAWDQTESGFADSTAATTQAYDAFYAARSAGQKSSTVFYAQAGAVDTAKLTDITKDVSLYVVPQPAPGEVIEIRDFILTKRMQYLKGAAFYQLTKTEPRVQPSKLIAVRDRTTGKIYAGKEARMMLGLPTDRNVRLHPGDHGNFDLFIQSSSVNRHLVGGTGVLYWEAIGVEFTEADLAYLLPKATPKPAAPAVVQLPAVAPTNKPTPSPLKKAKAKVAATPSASSVLVAQHKLVPARGYSSPVAILPVGGGRVRYHLAPAGAQFYDTRDSARTWAKALKKKPYDAGPNAARGKRFFVA